jgi:hypothetical protein
MQNETKDCKKSYILIPKLRTLHTDTFIDFSYQERLGSNPVWRPFSFKTRFLAILPTSPPSMFIYWGHKYAKGTTITK